MTTVKIPAYYYLTDPTGLEGVEKLHALRDNMDVLNKSVNGIASQELIGDAKTLFTVSDFYDIMSISGSVDNYRPFIKILESAIDNEIPEGLPRRTYTNVINEAEHDEEGAEITPAITEELIHTWRSWKQDNYTLDLIEGYYYYISQAGNIKGAALTGTELMLVYGSNDITLVDSKPIIEEDIV